MTHEQLVRGYFAACTSGDTTAVARHFTDDAVVYDLNHKPVCGAATIAEFFGRVRERWRGATWEVNTYLGGGDAAAIEWTMRGTGPDGPFAVRGSEHYEFADGAISQIRQYWVFDRDDPDVGLRGYPYEDDPRFTAQQGGAPGAS